MIIDTHVLLWMDRDDPAIGPMARKLIEDAWNKGQLAERGRIVLPMPAVLWREDWIKAGLMEIPLDGRIALLATSLENLHRDPADRFIIATAIERKMALLTADRLILSWPGTLPRIAADS